MDIKLDLKQINFRTPPKPVKIIVLVLPVVILVALAVSLVVLPKKKEIETLKGAIEKQEKEISKSESMAAKLDELIEENAKLKQKLKELEAQLPEEGEISSLLKQVTDLAGMAGLSLQAWSPGQKRNHPSGIVFEVPVSISLTGSYHRLGQFFSTLTQLDRIVNVTNITLSGPQLSGEEVTLSVGFTAVTFVAVADMAAE